MSDLFSRKEWYIFEQVGLTRLQETYDLFDKKDGQHLGAAVEKASLGCKIGKFFIDKDFLPLSLWVNDMNGSTVLSLNRPGAFFRSCISVFDAQEQLIAFFKQPLFHLAGKLQILDPQGNALGVVQGDFRDKRYVFNDSNNSCIGEIIHLSGGFLRDTFTSADDYQVKLHGEQKHAPLLLAAALAVDLVYHE